MYEDILERYPEIFQELAVHFGCEKQNILIQKQFGEGKSGDLVFLLSVSRAADPSFIGNYVLKIFSNEKSSLHEIERTYEAGENTEIKHILIPKLRYSNSDTPAFYLYDVAGDEFMQASNFAQLTPQKRSSRLEELSLYLLTEWNQHFISKQATLCALITDWVGKERLDGSRLNERVRAFISDELSQTFVFGGQYYPNPIYYLADTDSVLATGEAVLSCALYGQVHGDLNMDNIIVQIIPGTKEHQFYLIDFEQYHCCAPLLFDHAYLLLCSLLDDAVNSTLSEWCENIELFFCSLRGEKELSNKLPYLYMKAQSSAVKEFICHQQEHNRASVERQLLAAHVAAGLNFVNKRDCKEQQQLLAFMYAAMALRVLLESLGKMPDRQQNSPELQTSQSSDPELWRQVEHFCSENRYILLTSGNESSVSADHLLNLASIGWTMVVEVNHLLENPLRSRVLPAFRCTQGYHVYELPIEEKHVIETASAWIHLNIPETKKNLGLCYNCSYQEDFRQIAKSVLSVRENEPLFIISDISQIDPSIYNPLILDIIRQAGENTPIHVISLDGIQVALYSEEMIQPIVTKSNLAELSEDVFMLREQEYGQREVRIPTKDGMKRIAPEKVADLAINMTLVYRNIIFGEKDDNGEGFFHGNEASWLDIASERDVIRLDYREKWKNKLETNLEQVSSGAGVVIHLRHHAGGGGTTLAKRIAWDFCSIYPTVILHTLSVQTAERLKELYSLAIKPLLIISEVSDGQISFEEINALRRELIPKNVRALFLCVSRCSVRNNTENSFCLPDTPGMYMAAEEASDMFRRFSKRLREAGHDTDNVEARIQELGMLTYTEEYEELRQPFFYGLFTYGDNFHGVSEYVQHNTAGITDDEKMTLNILALITAYSQSINLSFEETALFLFPDRRPSKTTEEVKEWMFSNDLVVRRERGMRICHPLIANEILRQNEFIQSDEESPVKYIGTEALKELAYQFVDRLVSHYGSDSKRINCIFREIFTHRDVVNEDEQMKFSQLLTTLYTRERCTDLMLHIAQKISWNPHYWNHLARLYLYPVTQKQSGVFPEIRIAETYAQKAIDCAESREGEGESIHYHVLGKVYTQQCSGEVKIALRERKSLSHALRVSQMSYKKACGAFDMCISSDKSGYGLTGKLELIIKVLRTIEYQMHMSISQVLLSGSNGTNEIAEMISEAGDLISQYIGQFDIRSNAFRMACINFYEVAGNIRQLELMFKANASTLKQESCANRAISTLFMKDGFKSDGNFSYDILSQGELKKIRDLMEMNITAGGDNNQDRIRWLESYRRLPESTLEGAYKFLMSWPRAEESMFVCYYRYVIAFLIYQKTGEVDFITVKRHLTQAVNLSQKSYGQDITSSLNYYGIGETASEMLIPRLVLDYEKTKEIRIEQNKAYRRERCKVLDGKIDEIRDGMITIHFHCGNNIGSFFAKSPNIYQISLENVGDPVKFFLGFSYSGMRAWDVILDKVLSPEYN